MVERKYLVHDHSRPTQKVLILLIVGCESQRPAHSCKIIRLYHFPILYGPQRTNHHCIQYMARYEGDISKTNVNDLKFFKVAEAAVGASGKWATDEMM